MIIEELDAELMEWLSGTNLEHKQHEAMQLLTVSEDQWPHQAMISMGEVIAINPHQLRLALWPRYTDQYEHEQNRQGYLDCGSRTSIVAYPYRSRTAA